MICSKWYILIIYIILYIKYNVYIITVYIVFQDYTATIFLRQRWTDERLCFDGNKSLSLDGRLVEMLWVPDTFIVDSKKSFLHDITVENRLIRIYPNGTVLYAIRYVCTMYQPLFGFWLRLELLRLAWFYALEAVLLVKVEYTWSYSFTNT